MRIVNSGYNYQHAPGFRIERPYGSGDCILLVLRSPAFIILHGEKQTTNGSAVVLLKKDTPQIYGALSQEYINDWVHFEADEQDIDWMRRLGLPFDTVLPVSDILSLSEFIQNIFREFYSENKNAEASADLYFRLLLMKISDLCCAEQKSCDSLLVDQIKNIRVKIFENPQKNWNVPEIAAGLSISGSYFQHLYKMLFHKSVKKDIIASRLQYAEYLLFSTNYKIAVVSQQCGYQNDVHFMRAFKEKYGMTPTEYRRKNTYSLQKSEQAKERNPFCL